MKRNHVFALFVALLLAAITTPAAIAAPPNVIAEIDINSTTLIFNPIVEHQSLILTVTGPCGFDYRQVTQNGDRPYFKLNSQTIDGMYTFNLVRIEKVDSEIVSILKDARKNFDEETPKALCREGRLPAAPLVQADGFTVSNGKIIYDPEETDARLPAAADYDDPTLFKGDPSQLMSRVADGGSGALIPTKDFVINDDLIVDGSACIGFDCVNGESFSFDTIRLKENNLRIKFDDTSVAASFPRTDWQLTANASANGGASKFSIDDISGSRTPFTVEANARSHSLYVDDGGRIGNRTSTPSTEIHTIDGDTPTLRLQQDGSSGFAPQTWDVAGNETNFFIRDVSNGSTLPFRIRPSAPTSSIFIDVDGDVGVGTASPDGSLHVIRNGGGSAVDLLTLENTDGAARFEMVNAAGEQWQFNNAGNLRISDEDAMPNIEFEMDGDGNVTTSGTVNGVSDRNKKKDFVNVDPREVLSAVAELPITKWTYKHDSKGLRHMGPVAQDFYAAFGLGVDERHIALNDLSGVALAAIKGLNEENAELKGRLAELEALVAKLAAEK